MEDKQKIIYMYRNEGRSLREIAKVLNLHRATVTKVVRDVERTRQAENPSAALDDELASKPFYHSKPRPARVLKDEIVAEIDKWLAENERRWQGDAQAVPQCQGNPSATY